MKRLCAFPLILFPMLCLSCSTPEEPFGEVLTSDVSLYSQMNEELIIRDFFQDRRGGVFLDVGCSTPISNNTTYYLEKHLGWTGIGIDALPEHGPAWEKTRPDAQFFSYAVGATSGDIVTFYRASVSGVSSLSAEQSAAWGGELEPLEVPTITLTKLLDDNNVTKIDFLSMDIEGAEPDALAGFDIDRFKPELICIELGVSEENDKRILSYFDEHGYERIEKYVEFDHINSYFRSTPGE